MNGTMNAGHSATQCNAIVEHESQDTSHCSLPTVVCCLNLPRPRTSWHACLQAHQVSHQRAPEHACCVV
eukprot:15449949-Alexandrium_andersonii.AAC.2